jgi:hypothetical protein
MPIPSTYNSKGLQPEVKIYDINGNLQYTWQHNQIAGSPTRDFLLYGYDLHLGYGADLGSLTLHIHDHEKLLTDLTDAKIPSKLGNEWLVKFSLGKDQAGLKKWFEGIIRIPEIGRQPKYQSQTIFAVGKAAILSDWYITSRFIQKMESDGLTPDATDNAAKKSEIAKRLFSDVDLYPAPSIGTPGFTTNGIQEFAEKLASYVRDYHSITSCMHELVNSSGGIWGVDYEPATPDVFMHRKGSKNSGILVTNDIDSLTTSNWPAGKISFLHSFPRKRGDSTVERGYGIYYVLGAYEPQLDWNKTTQNAALALHENDFNFRITPAKPNIIQTRIAVQRVGTPFEDMLIYIVAPDSGGAPNKDAKYTSTTIKKERLQALSTGEQYLFASFELNPADIVPNNNYFIYIPKNGNSSHYIAVLYQTGAGVYYKGGSSFTGEAKLSTYFGQPIAINYNDINAIRKYGKRQAPITLPRMSLNSAMEIMNGYTEKMSARKRIYEPIMVSCPYIPVKPGTTIQLIDKFNGLNTVAEIVSLDISANAYDTANSGVRRIRLTIDEVLA